MPNFKPLPPRETVLEHLRYDPESGLLWWAKPWGGRQMDRPVGTRLYSVNGEPNGIHLTLLNKVYRAHRLIWLMQTGRDPEDLTIDHRNRDPFDNRWTNLRLADYSLQIRNQRKKAGCTSRHKGVSYYKRTGKWHAVACPNGKVKHLGCFDTEAEAAAVAAPHYIP